jgi:catechol 2,3-dioxygenase-like lactoylglutathione lyase family enzyme
MIDHMGFAVAEMARSKAFYEAALAPLGLRVIRSGDAWAAFGAGPHTEFWIGTYGAPPGRVHFAFAAKDRAAVDAFYAAAIKAGGKDNGPPGIRANYHVNYYAAFVFDPDGHNVEAVCHKPGS